MKHFIQHIIHGQSEKIQDITITHSRLVDERQYHFLYYKVIFPVMFVLKRVHLEYFDATRQLAKFKIHSLDIPFTTNLFHHVYSQITPKSSSTINRYLYIKVDKQFNSTFTLKNKNQYCFDIIIYFQSIQLISNPNSKEPNNKCKHVFIFQLLDVL